MHKNPLPKIKINSLCALTLGVVLSLGSSCSKSASPIEEGLKAKSIEQKAPANPTYDVTKGEKKVALVTFNWISDFPGTGGATHIWDENGSKVTISVTDPKGKNVVVTLTEAGGKISATGNVDRATIEIF
ncbi:MAG: hypothetical protein AB8D78_05695 [Akkermansiaceae bacterium]